MSSGTRIALALIAIFVGVLVVYYGFVMPTSDAPTPAPTAATEASVPPPAAVERMVEATPAPGSAPAPAPPRPAPREVVMGEPTDHPVRASERVSPPAAAGTPGKPLAAARTGRLDPAATSPPASASSTPRTREVRRPPGSKRPASPPSLPARPEYRIYTVQDGDTMSSIATRWFGDEQKWHLIAKANPLVDPSRLRIGQTLRIPPRGTHREPAAPVSDGKAETYTVRSGDTLSTIAEEVYGKADLWTHVYAANRDRIGSNPDRLVVGMELELPPKP